MPIQEVDKIWMVNLVKWGSQIHILTHALHYGSGF